MIGDFNRNKYQHIFNEIKGTITELNDGELFCSITIKVGAKNPREVNLAIKKKHFTDSTKLLNIGDTVTIKFFLSSQKKERWYTMANILEIIKV